MTSHFTYIDHSKTPSSRHEQFLTYITLTSEPSNSIDYSSGGPYVLELESHILELELTYVNIIYSRTWMIITWLLLLLFVSICVKFKQTYSEMKSSSCLVWLTYVTFHVTHTCVFMSSTFSRFHFFRFTLVYLSCAFDCSHVRDIIWRTWLVSQIC